MHAAKQPHASLRWLWIALIAFLVALIAFAALVILTVLSGVPCPETGCPPNPSPLPPPTLGQVVSVAVIVVSTLSGLVSVVLYVINVLQARRTRMAQPVAADKAHKT